jgi:hypothetical protein
MATIGLIGSKIIGALVEATGSFIGGILPVTTAAGTTTGGNEATVVFSGTNVQTYTLRTGVPGSQISLKNTSTDLITINRSGSDTIDGAIVDYLYPGAYLRYVCCAATTWCSVGRNLVNYGGMYLYTPTANADTAQSIDTQNVYQPIVSGAADGSLYGFSHKVGKRTATTVVATHTDGLNFTAAGHGHAVGDVIINTAHANAAYNGRKTVVQVLGNDNFTTAGTYTATGTGFTTRGSSLKVLPGAAGTYNIAYNLTGIQASGPASRLFKIEVVKTTTDLDNIAAEHNMGSAEYKQFSASGTAALVAGDIIWMQMMNRGGTEDFNLRHLNVTAIRIK